MNTITLVRNARRGDERSVAELVSRYEVSVRLYAAKVAPSPDMADDVAQDAFVEMLKSLDRFDENGDFGLWMRGIVRNVARRAWDRLYRDRRIQRDSLAGYVEELAATYESGEDIESGEQRLLALRACLERLPVKSSELVKLHYYLGMRCADIGARIRTSNDAVKMALMRIRRALRKCIREYLGESTGAA
jgi:RNA polymerase sigma-70 factor